MFFFYFGGSYEVPYFYLSLIFFYLCEFVDLYDVSAMKVDVLIFHLCSMLFGFPG
jgi:hypothetical protein